MRKQFTFYKSFLESIEKLSTNKEKLQAYQLICSYALEKSEPDLSGIKPSVCAVFQVIRPILDTAHSRSAKAKWSLESQPATCNNLSQQE